MARLEVYGRLVLSKGANGHVRAFVDWVQNSTPPATVAEAERLAPYSDRELFLRHVMELGSHPPCHVVVAPVVSVCYLSEASIYCKRYNRNED